MQDFLSWKPFRKWLWTKRKKPWWGVWALLIWRDQLVRHVPVFDPQLLELALQARHGVVSANVSLRAKDQRFADEPV